jgi:multidrug efflux pump subunit AcrA (membrane-fusion protein)
VLRRELLFKEGEPFRTERVAETERVLRSLYILSVARVVPVKGRRGGVALAPVIVQLDPDPALAPGQSVHVHLAVPSTSVLQVPLAAVLDPGGRDPYVLRMNDKDIVERVPIVPGRLDSDWVAVNASLAPGDRVVIAGQGRLVEGRRARVLR